MPAVVEKKEPVVLDSANWKMPDVMTGDSVVWYPGGDKSQSPSAAKVIRASHRSVDLRVEGIDQQFRQFSVRHVNDPALPHNDSLKLFGGWDYTLQYRELLRRVRDLEDLVSMGSK